MKPLRIGIDVHCIGGEEGGNDTYYRALVAGLASLPSQHQFILYYVNPETRQHVHCNGHFMLKQLHPAHPVLRISATVPWQTRRDRLDVFHSQYTIPPFAKCKMVTTIHDLAFAHFPEFFPLSQKLWFKTFMLSSARRADHIITVSEHSKQDIVQTYGIPADKITVTYCSVGKEFSPQGKDRAIEESARRYGIEGDFILYVGRLQARKNLCRLVDAFAQIRKAGSRHKLLLVGKPDFMFQALSSRIQDLGLQETVLMPGYVPTEDLPSLYSAADVFVYPSIYEGFGLPVLEAMACGVPVITSRGSSLEEVAGGAALIIDPFDERSIANALMGVLQDPDLRLRLRQAGLERSKCFNVKTSALKTLAVYEHVLGMDYQNDIAVPNLLN
jgi:glycosyltransferase involved in cell wall biosynthesis